MKTSVPTRLRRLLRRWSLRLRLVESARLALWGAVVGLMVGLFLAGVARLTPLLWRRQLIGSALLVAFLGVLGGVSYAWLRPRSLIQLARTFDRRFDLAQRLTTAVEVASGRLRAAPEMAAAQRRDTFAAAAHVDPRTALPLRPPRRALIALAALIAVLTVLLWLPNPQEAVLERRAAVQAALEEQVEALEAAQKRLASDESLTEAEREALLAALEEAMSALQAPGATPEEAVAALSEAEQALAPLRDVDAAAVRRGLERVAGQMQASDLTRDVAAALAAGDYETAAEALAAFSGEAGAALSRAEELELGEQLARAAEALQASAPELAQTLSEAAESIQQGNADAAREALRSASDQLAEAGGEAARQAAVEEALRAVQESREAVGAAADGGAPSETGQGGAPADGPAPGTGAQPGVGTGGTGSQPGPGAAVHSEDAGTGAPYAELTIPQRLDSEGEGVELPREDDDGVPVGTSPGGPPTGSEARVSYREIYGDYAEQAGAALERGYVPLGMKQYVRDYFSSLEPQE